MGTLAYPKSPREKVAVSRSRSSSFDNSNGAGTGIFGTLAEPVLKELFKWHSVSVFAFENVFFLDKIDTTWRGLFDSHGVAIQGPAHVRSVAIDLIKTFVGQESPWEITLPSGIRRKVAQEVMDAEANGSALPQSLFDQSYELVMRDLSRSMTQFQSTVLYASYANNKECLSTIFGALNDDEVLTVLPLPDLLARLRNLYRTTKPMKLVPDTTKEPFTHHCMVDTTLLGYALRTNELFLFFDLEGSELLKVPADSFDQEPKTFGRARSSTSPMPGIVPRSEKAVTVDSSSSSADKRKMSVTERFRKSFSKGSGKARSATVVDVAEIPRAKPIAAHLQVGSGRSFGPIAMSDIEMWWKFHVLRPSTLISFDGGLNYQSVATLPEMFPEAKRIQMIDPTSAGI